MYDTYCIYCGSKLIWDTDFAYEEIVSTFDEMDGGRTVTMMSCPKCGAEVRFVGPSGE